MTQRVVVVGGGLAGIAAALECADAGADVTLLERRSRLGGLTWSFQHNGYWVDNGQHVFMRCCTEYLRFLSRIDALGDVMLPARLDVPVIAPSVGATGSPTMRRLRRSGLPVPLHLAGSLVRYTHISLRDRLALARAVVGLQRLRLDDPALDESNFADWLASMGQSKASMDALWDLITVPTVNLPASEASLAMSAKVFKTGLLSSPAAGDIGWSKVPLGQLHGERAAAALSAAGVSVVTGIRVSGIRVSEDGAAKFSVVAGDAAFDADAVVMAVPHDDAGGLLPSGCIPSQDRLHLLGASAIVDVHLIFDRRVTDLAFVAGVGTPVQFVFDRTASSGIGASKPRAQYLAVSLSAADSVLGRHPEDLVRWISGELARLLPEAGRAQLIDSLVTKERRATFRAAPGTAALRPGPRTAFPGLAIAGAWTDTGWPATMEGAVRSGVAAARACLAEGEPYRAPLSPARANSTNQMQHIDTTEEVA